MAVKFNIPSEEPVNKIDINNFLGLDSKNLVPEYSRAQDMYNFIKKDGLIQIRPAITQTYRKGHNDEYGDSESGNACFDASTVVVTKNGVLPISMLQLGDLVLTKSGEFEPILNIISHEETNIIKINDVMMTIDQPIYVENKGFILSQNIRMNNVLVGLNKNINVINIEHIRGTFVVYDIKTNNGTYYVGNDKILVHCEEVTYNG